MLGAGDTWDNQGTLNILTSSDSLTLAASVTVGSVTTPGAVLDNTTGGQLVNDGNLFVLGTFDQDAGTVSGTDSVDLESGSALQFTAGGAGAFEVYQDPVPATPVTVSLSGDLAAGQSLTAYAECYSSGYGNIVVNATGSFTNAGPWLWSTSAAATAARSHAPARTAPRWAGRARDC